ncbi:hypothetical protein P879_09170 [Paragonimus westermani]|uniref:PB1 domain-containing protein n=1 Tax=Paragonimus westermani TaxID=34504 RepID=A0A8T0DHK9_9TREM|nr:hypothetical protein P879_09170 [Paragonimus westermani]
MKIKSSLSMTMRCIKFKYGSDIRKLMITENCDTYEKMTNLVKILFNEKLPLGCILRYKYVDGDGDLISILNDRDWKLALFSESKLKVLVYRTLLFV